MASMLPLFPDATTCEFSDFLPLLPPTEDSPHLVLQADQPDAAVSLASVTSSILPFGESSQQPDSPPDEPLASDDLTQWSTIQPVGVRARGGTDSTQAIKKRLYTKLRKEKALSNFRS